MKATFYDVKLRKKVDADVTEKVVYGKEGNHRYAIKGRTSDGRNTHKIRKQSRLGQT